MPLLRDVLRPRHAVTQAGNRKRQQEKRQRDKAKKQAKGTPTPSESPEPAPGGGKAPLPLVGPDGSPLSVEPLDAGLVSLPQIDLQFRRRCRLCLSLRRRRLLRSPRLPLSRHRLPLPAAAACLRSKSSFVTFVTVTPPCHACHGVTHVTRDI